jgi:hypothetical protein
MKYGNTAKSVIILLTLYTWPNSEEKKIMKMGKRDNEENELQ